MTFRIPTVLFIPTSTYLFNNCLHITLLIIKKMFLVEDYVRKGSEWCLSTDQDPLRCDHVVETVQKMVPSTLIVLVTLQYLPLGALKPVVCLKRFVFVFTWGLSLDLRKSCFFSRLLKQVLERANFSCAGLSLLWKTFLGGCGGCWLFAFLVLCPSRDI